MSSNSDDSTALWTESRVDLSDFALSPFILDSFEGETGLSCG